jgi:Ni/Co efflux regulator RcnB
MTKLGQFADLKRLPKVSPKMKTLLIAAAISTLLAGSALPVLAQERHDAPGHAEARKDQGPSHHWSQGERMGPNDWNGAKPVDWRANHLSQPRPGYEWRESNGQYVLAEITTGTILSIIEHN